jgi:predicted molibdopterin-dependent oxidoreductase YjgC
MRIVDHPILGKLAQDRTVTITVDGRSLEAIPGETILATLLAHGIRKCRTTEKRHEPRWFFCGIGRCTDCVMTVDGVPNVRTCVTMVRQGTVVETQTGLGEHGGGES